MEKPPERKRAQSLAHGDALLPRGSGSDRACDFGACADPATELVAQEGGSVLLVCAVHALDLTCPAPDDQASEPERAPVVASTRRPRRLAIRWLFAWRAALVACLIGYGLWLCRDPAGQFIGTLVGAIGTWVLIRWVRPRG